MSGIKKRASSPEQKAFRRQQIVNSARRRFEGLAYDDVNLNHVAADVGISKAALYRYFRNKETLFLALFVETLGELIVTAEIEVKQNNPAQAIVNTLLANPIYCKLSAILHTVLERSLTLEEATDFKVALLSLVGRYGKMITANSTLTSQQAVSLLLQVQQALIGCWHMSHPVGAVAEAIESEGLHVFKQEFGDALSQHIGRLVKSYL